MSRGDSEALREDVERVRDVGASDRQALRDLEARVGQLEGRIAALEAAPARRRWLRRREP
jgi:BMFP domain-containing protein YqiC